MDWSKHGLKLRQIYKLRRLSDLLMVSAWAVLIATVGFMILSPKQQIAAHAPFIVSGTTVLSGGSYGVGNNELNNCVRFSGCAKTVALDDRYGPGQQDGLPSSVTNSPYYPSQAWNQSDNLYTWVVKNQQPVQGGTAIYIYAHIGDSPSATHIHLWGWNAFGQWVQDNDLSSVHAWVGDIHLTSSTLNCTYGGSGHCAAHVLSHEVGHALGLKDETSSHTSIMYKSGNNIPHMLPSADDRETANECIWDGVFPC